MTRLTSAFAAWDRAVALGADATAADWSAVADAWRGLDVYSADARVEAAELRAAECERVAWLEAARVAVADMLRAASRPL